MGFVGEAALVLGVCALVLRLGWWLHNRQRVIVHRNAPPPPVAVELPAAAQLPAAAHGAAQGAVEPPAQIL